MLDFAISGAAKCRKAASRAAKKDGLRSLPIPFIAHLYARSIRVSMEGYFTARANERMWKNDQNFECGAGQFTRPPGLSLSYSTRLLVLLDDNFAEGLLSK